MDTSPFVGLAKVGRLDLLTAPTRQIWVADVVKREVLAGTSNDQAQEALRGGWGIRISTLSLLPVLAALNLDAGEAAVLSLALSQAGSVAIMDDSAGRAAAKALGVPVVGTVGVLLQAHQEGHLPLLAPVLRELQEVGLFLPRERLLTALLAGIGESWP